MNTMQKVTSAMFLLGVALLVFAAATSPDSRSLIIVAVATGLTGAFLVVVFARGGVVVRLQRGTVVLTLAAAAVTLAVVPLFRWTPTGEIVSDWPAKLAIAGSELLAGLAIVVVLSLFRRKPRKASITQDAE